MAETTGQTGDTSPAAQEAAPTGQKKFWFSFGGNQLKTNGRMLREIDDNSEGADDIGGIFMESGGRAFIAYSKGDLQNWKGGLKAVADGIYGYLGIPIPGEDPEDA